MYIDTLGNQTSTTSTSASTDSEDILGKDTFLTLLVAQLRHQDPLNPMEGTEFTAQLAQFSSLEQLQNVNDNMSNMQVTQEEDLIFKAMGFMGKEVDVLGSELTLTENAIAKGGFSLEASGDCVVTVFDVYGKAVKNIPMGYMEPGTHSFEWDGTSDNGDVLEEGTYNFAVTAVDSAGQELSVESFISGLVDRVNIEGGTPMLYVGDVPVALPNVRDVRMPAES
jgi:flagellar basal-body rod modification protein FlgD